MSYKPPASVAAEARRGLGVRRAAPKSRRGGTAVGVSRARDLKNRERLSLDTVKRMLGYFSRHLKDKSGATWESQGKGWQAWKLWGGDPGARWAARIVRREDPAWFNRFLEGPRNRALLRHLGISTRKV
jgi:hypothetical protein